MGFLPPALLIRKTETMVWSSFSKMSRDPTPMSSLPMIRSNEVSGTEIPHSSTWLETRVLASPLRRSILPSSKCMYCWRSVSKTCPSTKTYWHATNPGIPQPLPSSMQLQVRSNFPSTRYFAIARDPSHILAPKLINFMYCSRCVLTRTYRYILMDPNSHLVINPYFFWWTAEGLYGIISFSLLPSHCTKSNIKQGEPNRTNW